MRYVFLKILNPNRFSYPMFCCLFQLNLHLHSQILVSFHSTRCTFLACCHTVVESTGICPHQNTYYVLIFLYNNFFSILVTTPTPSSKGKFSFHQLFFSCMLPDAVVKSNAICSHENIYYKNRFSYAMTFFQS